MTVTGSERWCCVGPIKKGWWTIISIGAIGGLLFNMYSITTAYLNFPVNINIKVEHRTELDFPSVTICNMSPQTAVMLTVTGNQKDQGQTLDKSSSVSKTEHHEDEDED